MTIPEFPVTIDGVEYVAKYPVYALLSAERELGRSLTHIGRDLSLGDMAIIIKHGLHRDGRPISSVEFDKILNSMGVSEFTALAKEIAPAVFPQQEKNAGKN